MIARRLDVGGANDDKGSNLFEFAPAVIPLRVRCEADLASLVNRMQVQFQTMPPMPRLVGPKRSLEAEPNAFLFSLRRKSAHDCSTRHGTSEFVDCRPISTSFYHIPKCAMLVTAVVRRAAILSKSSLNPWVVLRDVGYANAKTVPCTR